MEGRKGGKKREMGEKRREGNGCKKGERDSMR